MQNRSIANDNKELMMQATNTFPQQKDSKNRSESTILVNSDCLFKDNNKNASKSKSPLIIIEVNKQHTL